MDRDDKRKEIEALHEEFRRAKNLFLAGFQGLTVGQDTELRRGIRATGSKYKVVKNTLARRASKDTDIESMQDKFTGSSAVAYNERDPVALAKALTSFAKNNPLFIFKTGVVEGRVIDLADLERLANLSSKGELISKLMFLLNSQAQRLATGVGAVARSLAGVLNQAAEQKRFKE
jgi:large subunit ribosomal protein L10